MKSFFNKVLRRIRQIGEMTVPFNEYLRPTDHISSEKYASVNSDVQCKLAYPGHYFTMDLPADLYDDPFESPILSANIPDLHIVSIQKGRIYSDAIETVAIMTNKNILLEDLSLEFRSKQKLGRDISYIFKVKYFNKPRYFSGAVMNLLIGGSGQNNYFHWMFDVLPRLHLLKKCGLDHSVQWYLLPNKKLRYQKDTLALLGIPDEKIIEGDKPIHIIADQIITPTPHRHVRQIDKWVCDFLREVFLEKIELDTDRKLKYIYLSRNDGKQRNVLNEKELIGFLEKFGFELVYLSGKSFSEQVRLFYNADMIVSPHGAGLANSVFCRKGTKIIELFSEGWPGTDYYQIAKMVELDYHYIFSRTTKGAANPSKAKRQHFTVDIPALKTLLANFKELQESNVSKSPK